MHLIIAHQDKQFQHPVCGTLQYINSCNDSKEQEESQVLTWVGSTELTQLEIKVIQWW